MPTKTKCAITREEFRKDAPVLEGTLAGVPIIIEPKEFSTDSLGWYANPKVVIEVGGKRVACQVGVTLTIIGSKELPK